MTLPLKSDSSAIITQSLLTVFGFVSLSYPGHSAKNFTKNITFPFTINLLYKQQLGSQRGRERDVTSTFIHRRIGKPHTFVRRRKSTLL